MCLEKLKIPVWQQKEEAQKKQSFDSALEHLGVSKKFIEQNKSKKEKKVIVKS